MINDKSLERRESRELNAKFQNNIIAFDKL